MKRIDKFLHIAIILMLISSLPSYANSTSSYMYQVSDTIPEQDEVVEENESDENLDEEEEDDDRDRDSRRDRNRTRNYLNFDFGLNNYLEGNQFPDATNAQYTVKPFGSWYIGISSVN